MDTPHTLDTAADIVAAVAAVDVDGGFLCEMLVFALEWRVTVPFRRPTSRAKQRWHQGHQQ